MIFLTGDVHFDIDINKFSSKNFPLGKILTKNDYVVVCGDFGLLWHSEENDVEKYWKKWLTNKPWTTLFVDGNHENFSRLNNLPQIEMFGDKVGKVSDSIFHLLRGKVYAIDENKFFCMGGAKSIDKAHRIENISWWKEEEPNFKELDHGLENLEKHDREVDYIITHTAPTEIVKELGKITGHHFGDKLENLNKFFDFICSAVKFKKFYFGHFHEDENIDGIYHALYNDIVPLGK